MTEDLKANPLKRNYGMGADLRSALIAFLSRGSDKGLLAVQNQLLEYLAAKVHENEDQVALQLYTFFREQRALDLEASELLVKKIEETEIVEEIGKWQKKIIDSYMEEMNKQAASTEKHERRFAPE